MKNRYSLLTLAIAWLCQTAAFAYIGPGNVKSSFAAGDRVFISSQYNYSYNDQKAKYLGLGTYSYSGSTYYQPAWIALDVEADEGYVMQLVDAETEVLGYPGYYIFFEKEYLYFSAYYAKTTNASQGYTNCNWYGRSYATPVALIPAADPNNLVGNTYKPLPPNTFYIACESRDGKPFCLSSSYDDSYGVTVAGSYWGGGECLFTFNEAIDKEVESYLPMLVNLYNAHINDSYTFGTSPGCITNEAVVTELYAALAEAEPLTIEETGHTEEEYEAAYKRLLAAVEAVEAEPLVPFSPGYYYVRPGLKSYGGRNAGKALRAYNKCIYIVDDANYMLSNSGKSRLVWELLPTDESNNYYSMRHIETNEYVCKGTKTGYQFQMMGTDEPETIWMYAKTDGSFCPYLYKGYETYTYYMIPYTPQNRLYYFYTGNEEGGAATYFFDAVPEDELPQILQAAIDNRLTALLTEADSVYSHADPAFVATLDQTVVGNLVEALAATKAIEKGTATEADITALQEAYTAFRQEYFVEEGLRATIDEADKADLYFTTGDGLGFSPEGTDNPLPALIEAAEEAINKEGHTATELKEQIGILRTAIDELMATIDVTPDPAKWYNINFATEEEYEKYGFAKLQGEGLFGTSMAIAADAATPLQPTDVRSGANLYFGKDGIGEAEMSQFRFLHVEDNMYAIQNRATGLFLNLRGKGTTSATVSTTPTLFTLNAKGAGKVVLKGFNLESGEACDLIHAQKSGAKLVGWDTEGVETNSAFRIIEAAEAGEEELPVIIDVTPGSAQVMTFPYNITHVNDGAMYKVAGRFTDGGFDYVGLKVAAEGVAAGEPFIYIAYGDYSASALEPETFYVGTSVVRQAGSSDCNLTGTFISRAIVETPLATLGMNREGVAQWETADQGYVDPLSGYINLDDYTLSEVEAAECDDRILLSDPAHLADGIAIVAGSIGTNSGACFDLSGRRLDSKRLHKGLYIRNKTKVLVK